MNPESDQISSERRDDLIDALLSEHARLGSADDEGLLATVRARTIEMPGAMAPVKIAEARFGLRDWMKVAATVMAALGLLWLVLQIGASGPIFESPRKEHTMRLVVIPQSTAEAAGIENEASNFPRPKSPDFAVQGSGGLNDGLGAAGMSFENFNISLSKELLSEFSVSAEKVTRGKGDQGLVYEGHVVLTHPDFTLKADRIELAATNVRGGEPLVGGFVASGDEIEIDRYSVAGAAESAKAQQVTYASEGGTLTLEGAPSLRAGSSFVIPESVSGVIVLRQDGYQVIEPMAASVPPLEKP